LKLLSLRLYSRAEIVRRLESKTSDQSSVNAVITWLEDQKFIDDQKFAVWFVESYSRTKPKGKMLLKRDLAQKGISPEIIELALAGISDEANLAVNLLDKKAGIWSGLPLREYRLKASRFLYSRGFGWNTIESAIKTGYNRLHVK
jgi:regulatory protein